MASVLRALFEEPLKPVKPSAQKKVAVPDGLNLDAWIIPQEEPEEDEFMYAGTASPTRPLTVCPPSVNPCACVCS